MVKECCPSETGLVGWFGLEGMWRI